MGGPDADLVLRGIRVISSLSIPIDRYGTLFAAAPPNLPADLAAELRTALHVPVLDADARSRADQESASITEGGVAPLAAGRTRVEAVSDLDELAAAVGRVLRGRADEVTGAEVDVIVDGLLAAATADRTRLRAAVGPLPSLGPSDPGRSVSVAIAALVSAAVGDRPRLPPVAADSWVLAVEAVVAERIFALAEELPPRSVAVPTWTDGFIDPADLAERLESAARDGWSPVSLDLEQALLRLDVPADADRRRALVERFDRTRSDAGRRAAEWVRAGRPTMPPLEVVPALERRHGWDGTFLGDTPRLTVVVHAGDPDADGRLWSMLVGGVPELRRWYGSELRLPRCWPTLAPRHRELIAAHCIPQLVAALDSSDDVACVLPELAHAAGPIGDATALALGYALAAGRPAQRAFGRDALAAMLAGPGWDGAVFGRWLGRLATVGAITLGRALEPIRSLLTESTAAALWPILRELAAGVIAAPAPMSGRADALGLAADTAQRAAARDTVRGLVEFAGRPGTSRQRAEARRLLAALTPKA